MTDQPETIECDAKLAHRAWSLLDIATNSDDITTYPADDKAREHLEDQLVEAGLLTRGEN